jgi:hypothetical protein
MSLIPEIKAPSPSQGDGNVTPSTPQDPAFPQTGNGNAAPPPGQSVASAPTPLVNALSEDVKTAILTLTGGTGGAFADLNAYREGVKIEYQHVEGYLEGKKTGPGRDPLTRDLNDGLANVNQAPPNTGITPVSDTDMRAAAVTIAGQAGGKAFDAAYAAQKAVLASPPVLETFDLNGQKPVKMSHGTAKLAGGITIETREITPAEQQAMDRYVGTIEAGLKQLSHGIDSDTPQAPGTTPPGATAPRQR